MKVRKGSLVHVVWEDITAGQEWSSRKKARAIKPCRCENVGWVFVNSRSRLTLVASRQTSKGHTQVGDSITIPQGCVVSVTVLD